MIHTHRNCEVSDPTFYGICPKCRARDKAQLMKPTSKPNDPWRCQCGWPKGGMFHQIYQCPLAKEKQMKLFKFTSKPLAAPVYVAASDLKTATTRFLDQYQIVGNFQVSGGTETVLLG